MNKLNKPTAAQLQADWNEKVSSKLDEHSTLQQVLDLLVEYVSQWSGLASGVVFALDTTQREITASSSWGLPEQEAEQALRVLSGYVRDRWTAITNGEAFDLMIPVDGKNYNLVPILSGGQPIGCFGVVSADNDHLEPDQRYLLYGINAQAGSALGSAWRYHIIEVSLYREQQRATELAYLYQIALDLMSQSSTSVTDTCNTVLSGMLTLLTCERACILLQDEDAKRLAQTAIQCASEQERPDWPPEEFCQRVFSQTRAIVGSSGVDIGVTLLAKDESLGILTAHRSAGAEPFSDHEIQLITLLASVTATVITNVQLQQNLNDRLSLLQTVMEGSPSGLVVIERGRLVMANPAALHALHLDYSAFSRELRVDGPDGILLERLNEALPPSPQTTFEYRVSGAHQRTRYLRIDVVSVGPDKILGQVNDITLLREIESRRDEAVANTSHELKTPLAVMNLGLSNLLSYYEQMPDEDKRSMIEETLEQVSEMRMLISSLLDQARKTKRTTQHVNEPGVVNDPAFYIGQVVNELLAFARYHDISLNWNAPAEALPPLQCPVQDLKTVVRNLLTNAIKYTPRGGHVTITPLISSEHDIFSLAVSDTGVGIPEVELGVIFDHSYRASTRGNAEGSGLGLSFVRDIVTKLGGTITVESQVNIGSTFIVNLPYSTMDGRQP